MVHFLPKINAKISTVRSQYATLELVIGRKQIFRNFCYSDSPQYRKQNSTYYPNSMMSSER